MSHTITIADVEIDVRVIQIEASVFEAVTDFRGTYFVIKGTSPEQAIERVKVAVERKLAE